MISVQLLRFSSSRPLANGRGHFVSSFGLTSAEGISRFADDWTGPLCPELTWGFYDADVSESKANSYGTSQKREFDVSRLTWGNSATISVLRHCILLAPSWRPTYAISASVSDLASPLREAIKAAAGAFSPTNLSTKADQAMAHRRQDAGKIRMPDHETDAETLAAERRSLGNEVHGHGKRHDRRRKSGDVP